MLRTISVPLDGSVFAEQALPLAVFVARHSGATLRLLHVVAPLADYYFMPPMPNDPMNSELRTLHQANAQSYLDGVVHRLNDAVPVICDVMEEVEGISESISANVVKNGVDLIVMSSHGRSALARSWLGSIADELVRNAPVPLLLARPPENLPAADLHSPVTLKHFVLALDGNIRAEHIAEPALAIGRATDADYTLVRVVRATGSALFSSPVTGPKPASGWHGLNKTDEKNCQDAEDYLRTVADRLRAEGATVQTRVHLAEHPAAAILQEAHLVGADLIALETHGRGASRLIIGSVTDAVLGGSSIPVLVCRMA